MAFQYVTRDFPTPGGPPEPPKGTAARGWEAQGGGMEGKVEKSKQCLSTKNVFLPQAILSPAHLIGGAR